MTFFSSPKSDSEGNRIPCWIAGQPGPDGVTRMPKAPAGAWESTWGSGDQAQRRINFAGFFDSLGGQMLRAEGERTIYGPIDGTRHIQVPRICFVCLRDYRKRSDKSIAKLHVFYKKA
jgi:hypothetical protein